MDESKNLYINTVISLQAYRYALHITHFVQQLALSSRGQRFCSPYSKLFSIVFFITYLEYVFLSSNVQKAHAHHDKPKWDHCFETSEVSGHFTGGSLQENIDGNLKFCV